MDEVWYTEPSGNNLPDPTAEQMIGFMRQEYDLWGPSSPVGVLCRHKHPSKRRSSAVSTGTATQRQKLLFVRHPKRGWYFEYSTDNLPEQRWLVPLTPDANLTRYTKHWAYGNPVHLLVGCFVPQAIAERVVSDYLATHEPSPVVSWVSFDSVVPRLNPAGYRARKRQLRDDA
jgi:hypothetical protein